MKTGVYKILNIINNKIYVGSSAKDLKRRWKTHLYNLRKQKHINKHLQSSYNKYGENNFKFEVIEYCYPELCIEREQFYIDTLNPLYNKCPTAGSVLGFKHTKESREKSSKRRTGIKLSPEVRKAISEGHKGINTWMKGRKLSLETRQKISKAHKGKERLDLRGKTAWNKGIPFSNEVRDKMSKAKKGKPSPMKGKFPNIINWLIDDKNVLYSSPRAAALFLNVEENTVIKAITDNKQIRRVRGKRLKYV